jgi:hypothetical protein
LRKAGVFVQSCSDLVEGLVGHGPTGYANFSL